MYDLLSFVYFRRDFCLVHYMRKVNKSRMMHFRLNNIFISYSYRLVEEELTEDVEYFIVPSDSWADEFTEVRFLI